VEFIQVQFHLWILLRRLHTKPYGGREGR